MTLKQDIAQALSELRGRAPLVHCITNYVTAGDTANMLLAAGASPMMADDPAECAEVTAKASALTLNLGTPSEARLRAMMNSGLQAQKSGIPAVFDPVGVGMTRLRREAAAALIKQGIPTAVRGNLSELAFLAGLDSGEHGVDSAETDILPQAAAQTASERLGCVCAVTGAADHIAGDGRSAVIRNGTPLLRKVTGAGCMTSALCAAFITVSDAFTGAAAGIAFMDICGELAAERSAGLGGFRAALFDFAGNITPDTLIERLDIYES